MKIAEFRASCPLEIGDKVKDGVSGEVKTVTDIVCTHYVKSGRVDFLFELDNSGDLAKIEVVNMARLNHQYTTGSPVARNRRVRRFTQRTPAGASLILDNPRNDIEAAEQVKEKFKGALNLLADFEDLDVTPGEMSRADVKEVCNILNKYPVTSTDFMVLANFCEKTNLHNESLRGFLRIAIDRETGKI